MRILLLFLCLSQNTFGQVSGKLITAAGQPIPFANVLLLKDSTIVKATLTDENGLYHMDGITPGKYNLRFSSIGYQILNSPLFELGDSGVYTLQEDPKLLGEIVVKAEKPLFQQQPDGMIVNVENSILTKGSSALAVLERSPGVVIDAHNYNISLNGKSGVMVMLNGKLMRMSAEQVLTLLNSMSADNIEKIELLTTPPAKYDAEGNAGMINIVIKKNKQAGTNGSLSLSAGYGKGEKGSGSINIARNTGKIDLYGAYSFTHDRSYSGFAGQGVQNTPATGALMVFDFLNLGKYVSNNHNATIGIDATLNPRITIGGSINYSNTHNDSEIANLGYYTFESDSLLQMNADIKGVDRWRNLTTSAYIKGKQFNVDIDYLNYNNYNPTNVLSMFFDKKGNNTGAVFPNHHKGTANTSIQVGVIKLDYVKQLSSAVKLETGVKAAYTGSTSVSRIESLEDSEWVSNASNDIKMTETIGALYTSINVKGLSIGARYEYSHTHMNNDIDRKLGKLFPNISYSKKPNEKSELQLSYTKRISRPSYNDLASYISYNDPFSVFAGNPLLQPTITNNLKLGYNYRTYSFSVLLSTDDNPIVQSQLAKGPDKNVSYIIPMNVSWQRNLTFQSSLPFKINDWWDMTYSLEGGWRQFKIDYTPQPVEKTYFSYSLNFSESFKLPKKFFLELSGWYSSAGYYGTIKTDSRGVMNAGIKKGNFQLAVSDILRTSHFDTYYGHLTQEVYSGKNHVRVNPESSFFPIIKLTYSRTIGGVGKVRQKREGAKDERERIRN
ncbi:Outer membrane receptor proteins, mostly Fe transport [Chitinophaga sp. CF118]|uniref:outer membrane beta-barrel family protein n=1 Tax=Chitinophaga sp. CF118 TaxID=1884367 RepID=UPI0008F41479|nr:outer membrane beta-barrel family protein [Chitinophaga sp. CF118]SFE17875.1 Outer membrane receptor proteins, mostly Fe transport [Chitinophaga sp. CF118]